MDILPFTPNYLRKNNAYEKNSAKKKDPTPVKKHTKIKNAIITVEDVEEAIAQTVKRVKSKAKSEKGTDKGKRGKVPKLRKSSKLARS